MGLNLLGRLAVAAGAAVMAGLVSAAPARADSTIAVNAGNVPTTASAHGTHDCDANFGDGPYSDSDIWVFVLPGNQDKVGDFVSVTAVFGDKGALTIPAAGGAVVTDKGTSKAWISTPAGWTLTGASAVITGTADKFNLTHTCPAGGGQTSSPSPSPSPSVTTTKASPGPTGGADSTPSSTGGPTGDSSGTAGGGSGSLPVTGTAVTGLAMVGGALVAGGIVLLVARRRRGEIVFAAEGESPVRGNPGS